MKRRARAFVESGFVAVVVLMAACGDESCPVTPTPVATSAVTLQGARYQGTITGADGAEVSST